MALILAFESKAKSCLLSDANSLNKIKPYSIMWQPIFQWDEHIVTIKGYHLAEDSGHLEYPQGSVSYHSQYFKGWYSARMLSLDA